MAPKRPSPLEEPPAASSSFEEVESEEEEAEEEEEVEEVDAEEEEEDDESDEEKISSPLPPSVDKKPSLKKPLTNPEPTPTLVTNPQSSSDNEDDGDGSESDSDSDHPPTKPRGSSSSANPNIKPINSKPMDDLSKSKKSSGTGAGAKRTLEYDKDGKDSKKKKKKKKGNEDDEDAGKKAGDDSKKQLFQRLWSEEDEIVILKGMIDFYSEKAIDPYTEMGAFHEFIKKSLHVDVSKNQLVDKVRRLKKKFLNNVGKVETGEDPVFSKPHEHKSFELSKQIWSSLASSNAGEDQVKANGKVGKRRKVSNFMASPKKEALSLLEGLKDPETKVEEEEEESLSQYPYLIESLQSGNDLNKLLPGLGGNIVKEGVGLIGSSKAMELEKKWKKLHVAEAEVYLQRVELIREQTVLIVDALKSSLS